MRLDFQHKLFWFGERSIRFSRYMSPADVLILLDVWIERLSGPAPGSFFLPFSVDEEHVEALEATLDGAELSLRVVTLDGIGFLPGVDSLREHVERSLRVVERRPKELLTCSPDGLREDLLATREALRLRTDSEGRT